VPERAALHVSSIPPPTPTPLALLLLLLLPLPTAESGGGAAVGVTVDGEEVDEDGVEVLEAGVAAEAGAEVRVGGGTMSLASTRDLSVARLDRFLMASTQSDA
jgi:hypothetical protein